MCVCVWRERGGLHSTQCMWVHVNIYKRLDLQWDKLSVHKSDLTKVLLRSTVCDVLLLTHTYVHTYKKCHSTAQ